MGDAMTEQVLTISHAKNKTGTITTSEVSAVTFPTSRNTGVPVNRSVRNTQLKLFSAALGFQRVQFLAFAFLAAILVGVIFWLPSMVTAPTPEELALEVPETEEKKLAPPDSPWSDAQLAKQRREAQEVLSKILDIQGKLEAKKVDLWAAADFKTAMETAASGDELYRQRKFSEAQANYRNSLQQFETLIGRVDEIYQTQMATGAQAIIDKTPQPALDSYTLALNLKPTSIEAQEGLKRAQAQEQVIELVKNGKHLLKVNKLADAKQQFLQALTLDADSIPAKEQLVITKKAIKDDDFARAMSDGYAALNQQQYPDAIKAFTTASKIKPAAKDAADALVQAKNKDIQSNIAGYLAKAEALEAQEQWQQANDFYNKMQALDASVIKARIGAIRTEARAKLDNQLQQALDQPHRLTAMPVFNQSLEYYKDALKIKDRGSRLNDQIVRLHKLLEEIQVPVAVKIQSNNQTTVTLYKVGKLGSFSAKSMDLKPGKYTLIGTRSGYRDVRREFTLQPGEANTTIVVQCDEKISNG